MLYLQMEQVEPVDLERGKLTIRCNDAFSCQMIEENRTEITKTMNRVIGARLRIQTEVREETQQQEQTMSPYEHFKELQKKDPAIRTIVELFGAELKY